jgi:hypothetical protein
MSAALTKSESADGGGTDVCDAHATRSIVCTPTPRWPRRRAAVPARRARRDGRKYVTCSIYQKIFFLLFDISA